MGISPIDYERMRSRTERKRHAPAQAVKDEIADLHQPILKWLKANNVPYAYNRPDKKSTSTRGQPDFIFPYLGYWFAVECKAKSGELSPPQNVWISQAKNQDVTVHVIWNLQQFYDLVRL